MGDLFILRAFLVARSGYERDLHGCRPRAFFRDLVAPLVGWFHDYERHSALADSRSRKREDGSDLDVILGLVGILESSGEGGMQIGVGDMLFAFRDFLSRLVVMIESLPA